MSFDETVRSFDLFGGQRAPLASGGVGVRILYRCPTCQRIWLQDGKSVVLDADAEQVARFAQECRADLEQLPQLACRLCLWKNGGGSVSIDEYGGGDGFGFCWEIPQPAVIHATSAILSAKKAHLSDSRPDVLTQPEKLRAVVLAGQAAALPQQIQSLPAFVGQLQAAALPPGCGQPGTHDWIWQGWFFDFPCSPLGGDALVTLLLAHPPRERIAAQSAFHIWQQLLQVALLVRPPRKA